MLQSNTIIHNQAGQVAHRLMIVIPNLIQIEKWAQFKGIQIRKLNLHKNKPTEIITEGLNNTRVICNTWVIQFQRWVIQFDRYFTIDKSTKMDSHVSLIV